MKTCAALPVLLSSIGCASLTPHQCEKEIFYVYESHLEHHLVEQLHDAFEYWNTAAPNADTPRFISGGAVAEYIEPNRSMVVVKFVNDNGWTNCGVTKVEINGVGCAVTTTVEFTKDCPMRAVPAAFQSLVRHEIGHVLGLDHAHREPLRLMSPELPSYGAEPMCASETNIAQLEDIYGTKR